MRLLKALRVRLGVDKFERVYRGYFRVQFFELAVVKEQLETRGRVEAKMVITVRANLQGFFKVAFVKRRVALFALDEDVFRLHAPFFDRYGLAIAILCFTKPGHTSLVATQGFPHTTLRAFDFYQTKTAQRITQ